MFPLMPNDHSKRLGWNYIMDSNELLAYAL